MNRTAEIVYEMKDVLLGIKCVPSCTDCMFDVQRSSVCMHTILLDYIAELKIEQGDL